MEGDPPPAAERVGEKCARIACSAPRFGSLLPPRGRVCRRRLGSQMDVPGCGSLAASGFGRFTKSGKTGRLELPFGTATPRTGPYRISPTETTELKRKVCSPGPGIPPTREPRPRNSHTPVRSSTAPQERAETAPGPRHPGKRRGRRQKRSARCQQTAPRKPPARARGTQAPALPRPGTPATESRGANEQRPRDPTHAGAQTQKQPHARTQPYSPAGESRDGTRNQAPRQKEGEAAEKDSLAASKRLPESRQPRRAESKHQHPPAQRPWPRKAGDPQLRRRGVGGGRARTAVYRSFCLRPDALQDCSPVCWSPIGIQDGGSALR
ncbi:uncharacterized protein PS065_020165 [Dugong dugon]